MLSPDPLEPWHFSDEPPRSMRWRMGPGEDCVDRWLGWFHSLTPEQRADYLAGPKLPTAWKAKLERWQRREAAGPDWHLLPLDDSDFDDEDADE